MPDLTGWPLDVDPAGRYELPDVADLLHRPAWHADAACREHPELSFFPRQGEPSGAAVAICQRCLVRPECLSAGLARREVGVWGGTVEGQRRKLRRRDVEAA